MCKDTDTDLEWLNPNETASGTLFLMQTTDICCARNCGYHVNETRRASPCAIGRTSASVFIVTPYPGSCKSDCVLIHPYFSTPYNNGDHFKALTIKRPTFIPL